MVSRQHQIGAYVCARLSVTHDVEMQYLVYVTRHARRVTGSVGGGLDESDVSSGLVEGRMHGGLTY